jgi:mannose-6-phosphate isomerase class I
MGVSRVKPQRLSGFPYKRKLLIKCEKFTMESIELNPGTYKENNDPSRFKVFSVVEGKGVFLFGPDKRKRQDYGLGNTFLIPAGMGNFEIKALKKSCILVCYI